MTDITFAIRPATEDDVAAIAALFAEGDEFHHTALPDIFLPPRGPGRLPEYIRGRILADDAAMFVAESHGIVVGLVEVAEAANPPAPAFVPRRLMRIDTLIVAQDFRRHGIGTALVERAEQRAVDRGLKEVELNVFEFNQEAIRLYEDLGFATFSRRMRKSLGNA